MLWYILYVVVQTFIICKVMNKRNVSAILVMSVFAPLFSLAAILGFTVGTFDVIFRK